MTVEDLNNDKEVNTVGRALGEALRELCSYATTHAVDDTMGKSLMKLVAAGALSPQSVAFIANHEVRFYGFKAGPISEVVSVLVLAHRSIPVVLIGNRDGSVTLEELARRPNGPGERRTLDFSLPAAPAESSRRRQSAHLIFRNPINVSADCRRRLRKPRFFNGLLAEVAAPGDGRTPVAGPSYNPWPCACAFSLDL